MLSTLHLAFLGLAAALLLAASLHDIAARTIPNWIPAALATDGMLLQWLAGSLINGLAVGVAVFIAAALLWRRGLMGGGDVKLLAAAAVAVPPVLALLATVALAGGVLALLYLLLRPLVAPPGAARPASRLARIVRVERRRIQQGRALPYACAIAAGALFIMIGN